MARIFSTRFRKKSTQLRNQFYRILWAITPCVVGLGFLAIVVSERSGLFASLEYGLLHEPIQIPLAWGTVAVVLLIIQLRAKRSYRVASLIRWIVLAMVSAVMLLMFLGTTGWGRYRAYRAECLGAHWGITAYDQVTTREDLIANLSREPVGPYVADDQELVEYLANEQSALFARHPRQSRVALAMLATQGRSIDEIAGWTHGDDFLIYSLAGESDPQPWLGLDWLDRTKAQPATASGLNAGLFQKHQAIDFLAKQIEAAEELSLAELEALVYCTIALPDLVEKNQRQEIVRIWISRLGQQNEMLDFLLNESLQLRDSFAKAVGNIGAVRVHLETATGYTVPYDATQKRIDRSLAAGFRGLIGSSAADVRFVEKEKADVSIELDVSTVKLYEYSQILYGTQERFESGRFRSIGGTRYYRAGRMVSESVVVGSETRNAMGASVSVKINLPDEQIRRESVLAYWVDYSRDDEAKEQFQDISMTEYEFLSGRIWPLGIHESYSRYYQPIRSEFE